MAKVLVTMNTGLFWMYPTVLASLMTKRNRAEEEGRASESLVEEKEGVEPYRSRVE